MAQKYIEGDFVMCHNKIMVIKEPNSINNFDLYSLKEKKTYGFVEIYEIKPVVLTTYILRKNLWLPTDERFVTFTKGDITITIQAGIGMLRFREAEPIYLEYVHELQHFLFGIGANCEMEV